MGSQTDVFKSDNQAAERGRVSVVNVGREFAEGREGGGIQDMSCKEGSLLLVNKIYFLVLPENFRNKFNYGFWMP